MYICKTHSVEHSGENENYCTVVSSPGDEAKILLSMLSSLRNEIKYESSSHFLTSLGVILALLAKN